MLIDAAATTLSAFAVSMPPLATRCFSRRRYYIFDARLAAMPFSPASAAAAAMPSVFDYLRFSPYIITMMLLPTIFFSDAYT